LAVIKGFQSEMSVVKDCGDVFLPEQRIYKWCFTVVIPQRLEWIPLCLKEFFERLLSCCARVRKKFHLKIKR
jgi:hypothetical protein